ncbi:MAG: hypothetical protein KIT22_02735 [Verrucomicrobiae bacterium]|nr:hypothetical protein [Verrucomicrobiae bacterium]
METHRANICSKLNLTGSHPRFITREQIRAAGFVRVISESRTANADREFTGF